MNGLLKKAIAQIAFESYCAGYRDVVARLDFEEDDARKAKLMSTMHEGAQEYSDAVVGRFESDLT